MRFGQLFDNWPFFTIRRRICQVLYDWRPYSHLGLLDYELIFDDQYWRMVGEGNGNPHQYSCLENSKDRGTWWATVHGVARIGHDLVIKPPPPPLKNGYKIWNLNIPLLADSIGMNDLLVRIVLNKQQQQQQQNPRNVSGPICKKIRVT